MIKSIEIKAFRNIKDKVYNCDKDIITISGNNTVGKTNTLNAIYWCLTGCDLEGSIDNSLNIPYGEKEASVKVVLDSGIITRTVNSDDFKVVVNVDGKDYGSKTVESKIDELLGISELAKKDTAKFKVRRFLLNPKYYQLASVGEFRKWFLSVMFKEKAEKDFIESSSLSEVVKKLVLTGESLSTMSNNANKKIKSLNAQIDKNKTIQEFLTSKCITAYNEELAEYIKKWKLELLKLQELVVAIDEAALEVSKGYEETLKMNFPGDMVLLEKGKDDEVWKEVCYPRPFHHDLPLKSGSTAETILVSVMFINEFERALLNTHLPKLIDEGETLDKKSLEYLIKTNESQLFITKVSFDMKEGIEVC